MQNWSLPSFPIAVPSRKTAVRFTIVIAFFCCLLSPVAAQTASFRSVDTNSDNVLSFDELFDAFGRDGAFQILQQSDHNNDGRVTIHELRQDKSDARDSDNDRDDRSDRNSRNNRNDSDDREDDDDDDDDDDD